MSEPGSWPSGPYRQVGQPPPYWAPTPPGPPPGPTTVAPGPGAWDRPVSAPASPPVWALVAVGIALGLSMLVGLSRWLGAYVNNTSADQFSSWPYRTAPVVVEVVLAAAGFAGAVGMVSSPLRRTTVTWSVLAVAAAVLGYALNDGLYQVLTFVV